MSISCVSSESCPFLFDCIEQVCVHQPIFPLSVYTGFVYLLLSLGVMLSNVGGLSAGVYKIPILMDMLNYPVGQATYLSYPVVTGASLANFILLVPQRHVSQPTSLVDYNIVLILIPAVIFGSTLGALIVKFIPIMIQDCLLIVVFILFTIFFAKKAKQCKVASKEEITEPLYAQLQPSAVSEVEEGKRSKAPAFDDYPSQDSKSLAKNPSVSGLPAEASSREARLKVHLEYEKGYHWRDILISVAVFTVFEILSLFSQGKFILHFSFCSVTFAASFGVFCLLVPGYLILVYRLIRKRLSTYRDIGYTYSVKLDSVATFSIIAVGGFIGGFLQGIIGLGSGNTMVSALLMVGIDPKVTSATSGYQIVFIGASSLIEALANQELSWGEVGWLFSVCFLIGGSLTIVMYRLMESRPSMPRILLIIITALCVVSVVGTIPSIILTHKYYGWEYMLTAQGFCN